MIFFYSSHMTSVIRKNIKQYEKGVMTIIIIIKKKRYQFRYLALGQFGYPVNLAVQCTEPRLENFQWV